jgi:hypothetical protein
MKWYSPLSWLPYTREGRQTLIYLVLAGCGPALCFCLMWILQVVETFPGASGEQRLAAYVELAKPMGWSLIIIVLALACFVSIRSIKGPGGFEAQGRDDEPIKSGDAVVVTKTEPEA